MQTIGRLVAISKSARKGIPKTNQSHARLIPDWGLEDDAHAGAWHRQVSLLALESIDKMRDKGLHVHPGSFAENLTTAGLDLAHLPIGCRIAIRDSILEITQIGKVCHNRCAIYQAAGDCVMPREGIFARVIRGGWIQAGDPVIVEPSCEPDGEKPIEQTVLSDEKPAAPLTAFH